MKKLLEWFKNKFGPKASVEKDYVCPGCGGIPRACPGGGYELEVSVGKPLPADLARERICQYAIRRGASCGLRHPKGMVENHLNTHIDTIATLDHEAMAKEILDEI